VDFFWGAALKTVRELICFGGLVFAAAVVADFYSRLPERIATHFNGAGAANGLGARSTLWLLVGIAFLLYAALSAISFLRGCEFEEAAGAGAGEGGAGESMAMVGWIKVELCWMFAYSLPGDGAEWDGVAGGVGGLVFAGDAGGGLWDLRILSDEDLRGDSGGLTASLALLSGEI